MKHNAKEMAARLGLILATQSEKIEAQHDAILARHCALVSALVKAGALDPVLFTELLARATVTIYGDKAPREHFLSITNGVAEMAAVAPKPPPK
jgi:hypothetical protein